MNRDRISKFKRMKLDKKYRIKRKFKKTSFFTSLKESKELRKKYNKPLRVPYYEKIKYKKIITKLVQGAFDFAKRKAGEEKWNLY